MGTVEAIAIVGIGCRLPGGVRNPDDLWRLLASGVDAISEVPDERWHLPAMYHPDPAKPGRMYSRWGGFIDDVDRFDAQFFGISPREAALADPQQRLLLEVAYQAVEDAGFTLHALAGKRAGVFVGISTSDYGSIILGSSERATIDAYSSLGSAMSIAANRISYFFNLLGPSLVVDTACSSSLVAAHLACRSIWNGESELAFVGGVNAMLRPETTIGVSKAAMLSPDGRCRSFDSRANGYVRGEGAAVVILKPLARALADRDRIHALIRATAVNQDGRTEGISVPSRVGQEENLRAALSLADIAPESVQYVEAHGTGTPVGDPIEAAALGAVYGKARKPEDRCAIGSIKSNIGHLEAAAGITGLIKAALCLRHRQIPASLHFEKPNPQIPFEDLRLRVAQRLGPWPQTQGSPPRAGVNSFGFGGTNGHAILEAAPATELDARVHAEPADDRAWILPLSTRSASALADLARCYLTSLRDERGLRDAALRDICYSAALKRSHHEFRLALVAHDRLQLVEQIEAFLRGEDRPARSIDGGASAPPRPVFVCSGMGQQWWAMGRELFAQQPVYRRTVEEVSELFGALAGWSLMDKLAADEARSQIQETDVAQPALFALQMGLAALWRSWGIEPVAVLGHSVGEVAASCIAGALLLEDAVRVVFHRSRLQRRTAGEGGMLAAGIPREEAARLVDRHPGAISLAAVNGPSSVTLSGDAAVLAEIDKVLNDVGLFSRALQVEVPYHSPKMDKLQAELEQCLRDIRPRPASTPFFSSVTGRVLLGPELDAQYWCRNMRQTVLFQDAMRVAIDAGHRLFVEIGAHPILRNDILACMNEKSVQGTTLCSLRRGECERAALFGSLGRLYCLGAEIAWQNLFPHDAAAIKLPAYPFQRESYWRESDLARQVRRGGIIHPLLGNRVEAPQPTWKGELDTADLSYLADHRLADAIVFPAAGYVEMALAAARETFGPSPCVLEDVEFLKPLVLDEQAACAAQIVLDTAASEFAIHARPDASDDSWDLYAQGKIGRTNGPEPAAVDLGQIRRRCTDPVDRDEHYRLFASLGLNYGPAFRGLAQLWRTDREVLAEIHVPGGLSEERSLYRLHPAVLDACLQAVLATVPAQMVWHTAQAKAYLPVKFERISCYAAPSTRVFAHVQLQDFGATGLTADIRVLDEIGNCLLDARGFLCRPARLPRQGIHDILYEYQWKLSPRPASGGPGHAVHAEPTEDLAPVMQKTAQILHQRFDRVRFQNEVHRGGRAAAAAYIVRALRALGWTPALNATMSGAMLADRLGLAPHYRRWLSFMLQELTADELSASEDPHRLWRTMWDEFPECQAEAALLRLCGEKLAAVLRCEVDPLQLMFSEAALPILEVLYGDSESIRLSNLLVQKAIVEIVQRLPRGKALRILEVGAGTGGTTSYLLPVLPEHCCEYLFTDVSPRFLANAQHKFTQYPFVQYRTLDLERDPLEQGFDPHAFDVIVAADVLHATKDLRQTLDRLKALLGAGGTLALVEMTRPWLAITMTFGLLREWWSFDDDVRQGEPCLSQAGWRSLLGQAGFSHLVCVADCPDAGRAQHSIILARGPQLPQSSAPAPTQRGAARDWLLFVDAGAPGRPSAGARLARRLRACGDRVIEVTHGVEFRRLDGSGFSLRAGYPNDMRRLLDGVSKQAPSLAGIVHLWSLDTEPTESITHDALVSSARLGCVGVLHLLQAIAASDGLGAGGISLITRAAQPLENRAGMLQVAQSPLWGLGRVAVSEYQNVNFRMVDLSTCSDEEIASLAQELQTDDATEDEIALHGELRYVHRLVPVSPETVQGMGQRTGKTPDRMRIEVQRPGILDSLSARSIARTPPKPNEVEIEVVAVGLNFRDLMLAMGMLPKEAIGTDPAGTLPGVECAGRVVAVGEEVETFAIGDEVIVTGAGALASHITVDAQYAAQKPPHLSFEQAAGIPVAFLTAFYSLHTLGNLQRGERVLIHSATGGVGLAAVQLSMKAGAIVFATAGSPEKRELLTALGVPHVMDSRSLAFADEVLKLTDGEGVDLVLNSLAGEAIDKNLSILREDGRFIEIGKIDIYKNRKLGMRPLRKNVSLFGVDMMSKFKKRPDFGQSPLGEILRPFASNDLRALPHRVFPVTRVADAFRHMAQAKHVGKLIISMQDALGLRVGRSRSVALDADASYLVTGGLGGLGLAVADRLTRRGARHLALVGRSAPSPSAQAAVESLRRRGVEVRIFQADIADAQQAQEVIAVMERAMPPLRGIMHAAMVLDDAPIEGLSEARMWKAMAPKILGAWNLHSLTADARLDFFVLFSSVASITGTPGQANYVAGNAFLDALAYYRRACGLPALTVNWGVIGDVGHVASSQEMSDRFQRFGFSAIPLSETLDTIDELLGSDAVQVAATRLEWARYWRSAGISTAQIPARFAGLVDQASGGDDVLVTRTRVREIVEADEATLPSLLEAYIRDRLARAMGTSPARIDTQQPLLSLGLDSLIAVEVRNRINAELGLNVPLAKIVQSTGIVALAGYIAERLREGDRDERAKPANDGMAGPGRIDIRLNGDDAAGLIEPVEKFTDDNDGRHSSVVTAR